MEGLNENLSELAVLPSIDDDIDTGVKNKEQVGDVGKDRALQTIAAYLPCFWQALDKLQGKAVTHLEKLNGGEV